MYIEVILLVVLAVLILMFFYYVPFLLWISAKVSGVKYFAGADSSLMRIRKVPPRTIVQCLIEAHKAGLGDGN